MTSLRCWLALLLCLATCPAQALVLDGQTGSVAVWPQVRVLVDASGTLGPEQVLARRGEFVVPDGPYANLGLHADPVWLLLTVGTAADAPSQWILSVDYASIDRIDVYQPSLSDAAVGTTGRLVPLSQRLMESAVHAAPVTLRPGGTQDLLLKVQTRNAMVLPLSLSTPEGFHSREARRQLLQGLMAGALLCLLVYSLTQWVAARDNLFLAYALVIGSTGLFFFANSGLGPQHLWGDHEWLNSNLPVLLILIAIVGACWFIELVLEISRLQPWLARALRVVLVVAGLSALAFAVGLMSYPTVLRLATALGPLPMLLAIPAAWRRARSGERIGTYMLVGWGAYAMATLTMVALLRGWVGANAWTVNAFQVGAMFEAAMWMRVIALRIEGLQSSAQRAHVERDMLRTLALTDALTGLPNRRSLFEFLERALERSSPQHLTAVYLLDLDGFKPINDRLGHEAGDEVLVGVAQRLQSLLRGVDVVARLGGDEFVVVASGLGGDVDAEALGRKLLGSCDEPFIAGGQSCRVQLTIGYALAPLDGQTAACLLRCADAAMYAGKQAGRHCLRRGEPNPAPALAGL